MIETIPNPAPGALAIQYCPPFSAICSVGQAPFHGTLDITCTPGDRLLEFESFERWLREDVARRTLTIEDLCVLVHKRLHEALGDIPLRVTVRGRTTVHAPVSATIVSPGENRCSIASTSGPSSP